MYLHNGPLLVLGVFLVILVSIASAESASLKNITFTEAVQSWKEKKCIYPHSSFYTPANAFSPQYVLKRCEDVDMALSKGKENQLESKLEEYIFTQKLCQSLYFVTTILCDSSSTSIPLQEMIKSKLSQSPAEQNDLYSRANVCSNVSVLSEDSRTHSAYADNFNLTKDCDHFCSNQELKPICVLLVSGIYQYFHVFNPPKQIKAQTPQPTANLATAQDAPKSGSSLTGASQDSKTTVSTNLTGAPKATNPTEKPNPANPTEPTGKPTSAPDGTPKPETLASGNPNDTPKPETPASGIPDGTPKPETPASGIPDGTPKPETPASGNPDDTPKPETPASGNPDGTPKPLKPDATSPTSASKSASSLSPPQSGSFDSKMSDLESKQFISGDRDVTPKPGALPETKTPAAGNNQPQASPSPSGSRLAPTQTPSVSRSTNNVPGDNGKITAKPALGGNEFDNGYKSTSQTPKPALGENNLDEKDKTKYQYQTVKPVAGGDSIDVDGNGQDHIQDEDYSSISNGGQNNGGSRPLSNHPQDQSKYPALEDESPASGHFFAYFLTAVVICISGYVIFHNKQKILAFIVEGRSEAGRRRGAQYSQLKSNVEEVMPSLDKATTAKNFVY